MAHKAIPAKLKTKKAGRNMTQINAVSFAYAVDCIFSLYLPPQMDQ